MKKTKLKRRSKSPLAKLKEKLWQLCRKVVFTKYGTRCFTCGRGPLEGSNLQLGHFIASSLSSVEMRYEVEGNLKPQCYMCNINHSGNTLQFRRNLIRDHGIEYVEELEARNERTKGLMYREEWYEAKIAEYKKLFTGSSF
jgi:hypothetical protein